jgi:hypothetical protein
MSIHCRIMASFQPCTAPSVLALGICLVTARSSAQATNTVVVPSVFQSVEAVGGSGTFRSAHRLQQVYGSGLFPAQRIRIHELRWRPDAGLGAPFSATVASIQINLSTTAAPPDGLNPNPSANVGTNDTAVFSGPLNISSAFQGPAGGPKVFDIIVRLSTPFVYDRALGNLLIDIRNNSGSLATIVDAGQASGDQASRMVGSSPDSAADAIQIVYTDMPDPPILTQQPADQTVFLGEALVLKARASGAAPLYFRWFFDATPVPGGTGQDLVLGNAELAHSGAYVFVASNSFGVVTSRTATVVVRDLRAFILPAAAASSEGGFASTSLRDVIRWQNIYGGSSFPAGPILIRELRFRPSASDGFPFTATISDLQISLSSTIAQPDALSTDLAQNAGTNDTVVFAGSVGIRSDFQGPPGGPKNFDIVIPLATPFFYDPLQGNLLVDIKNFSGSGAAGTDMASTTDDNASRAFRENITGAAGRDSAVDIIQFVYSRLQLPPAFLRMPASRTAIAGDTVELSFLVTGTPPFHYQWQFNGTDLGGATNTSLTLAGAQPEHAGQYTVIVTNAFGTASSEPAILVVTNLEKLVVPRVFENVTLGTESATFRLPVHMHQVYEAAQFPPEPILIQQLRFRPGVSQGSAFTATLSNLQVNLSTTSARADELNSVFEDNVGPDDVLAFNGPITLSSQFRGPVDGPKEFDITVPLTTPFHYDPASGNLLLAIRNFAPSTATFIDAGSAGGDQASRAYAGNPNATIASGSDSAADIVQLIYSAPTNLTGLSILVHPQSRTVTNGSTVALQVFASGARPISYQWLFNSNPLLAQTRSSLVLSNVQFSDAGSYAVIVSNSTGSLTSSPAILTVVAPPPAYVTRGPYLQNASAANITVRWRTDRLIQGWVRFGPAPGNLPAEVADPVATTEHSMTLPALSPNRRYYYALGTGTNELAGGPDYFFVTSPTNARPTRIWALGDCGTASVGSSAPLLVRDAYYTFTGPQATDVLLMLGDNAYGVGTDSQYQAAVFEVYHDLLRHTPLWSTIGNHETYAPGPGGHLAYYDIFSLPVDGSAGGIASGTERYYSFNYGNIHFVCLDSEISSKEPAAPMLTWLEQDLAANTQHWLIAFWHSPPYSKGSHNSDFEGNLVQMRQWALPVLEGYGVDLVLCGHSHSYERSYLIDGHYGLSTELVAAMLKDGGSGRTEDSGAYRKASIGPTPNQGAVYVVAGSAGQISGGSLNHPAMFIGLNRLGSLVIDIDGQRLDARFLRETGAVDDHFTIFKDAPPEPLRFATFHVTGGAITAQFKSLAGRTYRIQRTPSLATPAWEPAGTPIVATGATTRWNGVVTGGSDGWFYRVISDDPP